MDIGSTHRTKLFEVAFDILQRGGGREAAHKDFLCSRHHLQEKKVKRGKSVRKRMKMAKMQLNLAVVGYLKMHLW